MSARKRALSILVAALLLAGLSWRVSGRLADTRFAFGASAGGGDVRVTTAFPAATCAKTLSRDFPWVRFACEPRAEGAAGEAPATPLDTAPRPE